ncbi:MAG TPA: lytic transglycosylase domain-containing protein [Kiritimatiellia bacterium]|nr:lytic transglycosylase domain-containing protein [Kiritimatiellia bacterium]HMP33843.1 lytic transglycosylase domain-containing protein [Kiritimatiellia bacterium]
MKTNAISEFKVWTVFMAFAVSAMGVEVAVKSSRPVEPLPVHTAVEATTGSEPVAVATTPPAATELPETLVADLLVDSVVQIESAGNARAVGRHGERGLMQIKRETWRETTARILGKPVGFDRAFEPTLNRRVGAAYLSHLHGFLQANKNRWQADERSLLLACYNAGPNRVAEAGFNLRRLPRSTQDYVARASALHDQYLRDHAMQLVNDGSRRVLQIVQLQPGRDS